MYAFTLLEFVAVKSGNLGGVGARGGSTRA
jgi:hypothetical protein